MTTYAAVGTWAGDDYDYDLFDTVEDARKATRRWQRGVYPSLPAIGTQIVRVNITDAELEADADWILWDHLETDLCQIVEAWGVAA